MEKGYVNTFRNINRNLNVNDINTLSPLQLAYIGDAVYELCVRTYLLNKGIPVNTLHKETTQYVKAKSQSNIVHALANILTDEEKSLVRRGRNAKTNSIPKNAELMDYKYATGFESLIGYLYLAGRDNRMVELFDKIIHLPTI
ncbi:Mini-ribonuclease 3 [Schnuerera sp.]|uniref:Mini-ribonuclease 3 n=1 Tax=Schnuerera sp. TaxID=2794844 RepID=UPI002CFCC86B|nr:ribonuclease III domain-containing protein [Schnuerera sp.]HSH36407.1 ribonuclease III domain-containing protein [Schnuerera sp.]